MSCATDPTIGSSSFTVVNLTCWRANRHVPQVMQDPHGLDTVIHGLRVISDQVNDATVVRAIGEVDLHNAASLAVALRAVWADARAPSLMVVDLTGIGFCSVAGLALLLDTEQHCRQRELPLRVVATTRGVLRALRVTGLDVLFDITPSVVAAIRPWTSPEWTVVYNRTGDDRDRRA